MNTVDPNMSLTPPSQMSVGERMGAALCGLGLLGLLIAFLGARIPSYIPMGFGLTGLITGGVLMLRKDAQHRKTVQVLFAFGGISILLQILVSLNLLGVEDFGEKGLGFVYWILFALVFGATSVGALMIWTAKFGHGPAGIRNNGTVTNEATRKQGVIAWMLTILFTGFYVVLYWFPDNLAGLTSIVKPLKVMLTGNDGNAQWFLYGLVYTVAVIVMGIRFILKYRHSRYQQVRTYSVMFFQLILAFLLPSLLEKLNTQQQPAFQAVVERYKPDLEAYQGAKQEVDKAKEMLNNGTPSQKDSVSKILPALEATMKEKQGKAQVWYAELVTSSPQVNGHYFTYFFPLDYDILWPSSTHYELGETPWDGVFVPGETQAGFGTFGWIVIGVGLFMSTIGVVVLTYFFGKRWYCSWVCGCGGLAETAGDSFRHLSDKSVKAWRVERVLIYSVLALILGLTALLVIDGKWQFLGGLGVSLKSAYGFLIASCFAGVVGTGFYPILGSRAWCRFGCPQAAILGLLQRKFSRFRITTNGGQCISCGNCSTYCEMGIDVKAYAQRGQDIVRASCVGCGICSAVCPRGVLNLENGPIDTRNLNAHTVSGINHPDH
jgi:Pyruvate/2-oxoacid:ferredoxin oxidoreductase delta subunit/uncharacterized membrane protein SirB2